MTKKQFDELKQFRYVWPELVKISNSLQRIAEKDCNYGLTERDVKRRNNLEKKALDYAANFGLACYFHRDPRGCALHLITKHCRQYTDGIAVY